MQRKAADASSIEDGSTRLADRLVGEDDYPSAGVQLGQGWDSYLGQRTQGLCVKVRSIPLEVFESRTSYTDLFDREQLFREMKLSVKASYGGMVSGRASFSQSVQVDNKKRNIFGKVFVNNGGSYAVPVSGAESITLTDGALGILRRKDGLSEFKRVCGDTFVTAIHKGGRYDAVFSLDENQKEVTERFKLSIKGSYGGFSGRASASSLVHTTSTQERLKVDTNQMGGQPGIVPGGLAVAPAKDEKGAPIAGADVFTAKNVVAKIAGFETMAEPFARPYAVSLESYKTAQNYPPELSGRELYAGNMLTLAANVWRYRELADLYGAAAEPPRFSRRLVGLSQADVADSASWR